jgi:hypothetical protein
MASRFHTAWEHLFEQKQFDTSREIHYITAKEIKQLTGEEPRLMAKVDSSRDLPPIFKQYGYFLLPVSGSEYAIVRGNGFHALESLPLAKSFTSRVKFNLTTMHRNTSEMQYLDYSHIAGAIEEVVGRGTLYSSIRGREGSGSFGFNVSGTELNVRSAQIEVDLGLEGEDCIVLLEAKSKTPSDFIIRQLYYPYRRFKNLTPDKKVIPVFFTFDATLQSYNYWVYEFNNLTDYNSLKLLATHSYMITTIDEIEPEDIYPVDSVYKDLVPQANNLDKVLGLIFKVKEGMNNATDIAAYFDFDKRQSSYYREAAEALGFISLEENKYHLTDSGTHLTGLDTQARHLYFSRVISNFSLVKIALDVINTRGILSKADLEHIVAQNSNLSGTTVGRRASSLHSWLKWISVNTGAYTVDTAGCIKLQQQTSN